MKNFYFYQKKSEKKKERKARLPRREVYRWYLVSGTQTHRHIQSAAWALCHCFPCAEHIAGSNCSLYLCVGLEIDRHTCGFCGTCTVIFNSCVFFYSWCEYSGVKAWVLHCYMKTRIRSDWLIGWMDCFLSLSLLSLHNGLCRCNVMPFGFMNHPTLWVYKPIRAFWVTLLKTFVQSRAVKVSVLMHARLIMFNNMIF